MTIDELLASAGLTANDEIPLWDAEATGEEPTKKITATNLAAAVKLLASLLAKSDVKDSLSDTSVDYPLSAKQGKVLNDRASAISADIAADYDATATYAVGDLCVYQNTLYRCNTAITTAEAWTAAHWTATTVEDELSGKLTPGDVVNNLTSTSITNPLSAAQGKALNEGKANIKKEVLAGNSSVSVAISNVAFVLVGRASTSVQITAALIDQWSGIIYLSNNTSYTISASSGNLTITNNTSSYANYIVIY